MLVFWWHGRGYQTIWIWLVTMCIFGVVATIGRPFIPDRPWYWGGAFCVAAVFNWIRGTSLNAKSLSKIPHKTIMQRLFYRAHHKFMPMPMETFSIILVLAGVAIAIIPPSAFGD